MLRLRDIWTFFDAARKRQVFGFAIRPGDEEEERSFAHEGSKQGLKKIPTLPTENDKKCQSRKSETTSDATSTRSWELHVTNRRES